MIKVALVKDNGEVSCTVSPAVDSMYLDGEIYSGFTARHIAHTEVDAAVIATWYWKDGWQTREANTGAFMHWVDYDWVFNYESFWGIVKQDRDMRLLQSDWTQVTDSPLTTAEKAEWATYRQALRDVPEDYSDATSLDDVVWPTKP
tara:strand:- start:110 stop:547 length:438 start_codon:yes stop_codon:yes gene_type:complete